MIMKLRVWQVWFFRYLKNNRTQIIMMVTWAVVTLVVDQITFWFDLGKQFQSIIWPKQLFFQNLLFWSENTENWLFSRENLPLVNFKNWKVSENSFLSVQELLIWRYEAVSICDICAATCLLKKTIPHNHLINIE